MSKFKIQNLPKFPKNTSYAYLVVFLNNRSSQRRLETLCLQHTNPCLEFSLTLLHSFCSVVPLKWMVTRIKCQKSRITKDRKPSNNYNGMCTELFTFGCDTCNNPVIRRSSTLATKSADCFHNILFQRCTNHVKQHVFQRFLSTFVWNTGNGAERPLQLSSHHCL